MARRMQPARSAEASPMDLALRGVTPTAYVERYGGYSRTRDLGCLMWQVAMLLDHLQMDNIPAAKDSAALLAVCLEQSALDNGKMDIGLLLSLSEDPPAGVFQNKAMTNYAKGRAFAPLVEQRWVTTALSYIKEMDLIASKRQDATGGKPGQDANADQPNPKKAPKSKAKGGKKGQKPWRGVAPASVVFPLPLMDFGLFRSSGPKLTGRKWKALIKKRVMHILIIALNFLEGNFGWEQLRLLGRSPNALQRRIHARLWALLTTCELSGTLELSMVPGRSGMEFIATLQQLENFASRHQLFDVKGYASGPVDLEKEKLGKLQAVDRSAVDVEPYTALDADRLKLVGSGKWHLEEWLRDELYLPYLEPKVLHHHYEVDFAEGPNFSKECRSEYLKLAKKWDKLGLLGLTTQRPERDTFTRIFNARKDEHCDRQIGDRRLPNMIEFPIRGPSQFLLGGYLICNVHVPRGKCIYAAIADRKDFYRQSWVTDERAAANVVPFAYSPDELAGLGALNSVIDGARPSDRLRGGDRLGWGPRSILTEGPGLYSFRSLLQGDHLGVEFALSAHGEMLKDVGLLGDEVTIRGHHPFPGGPSYQGLVIDDVFLLSVEAPGVPPESTLAVDQMKVASAQYDKYEVLGSPEKDIAGSCHFKVVGAEVDSSRRTRSMGLVTVSAPLQKRLAMIMLTLRAARLPVVSAALASRLAGNWTSIFMYRRCLACVLNEVYAFAKDGTAEMSEVYELPRSTAQELVLAAVLSFVALSDVSAGYHTKLYATDASMRKGAVVSRDVTEKEAKVLWLGGDKKGAYAKLDPPFRQMRKALGDYDDEDAYEDMMLNSPEPPLEFAFDFVEICGGVGSVSKAMAREGYQVLPPIELSDSVHFDIQGLRLVEWICYMLRKGRLKSLMVEPVCTTFSAAAHPSVRSYKEPKGYLRSCPKTLQGNLIAFRCLFLLWYAHLCDRPGLAEQPRLSKMAWLSIWQFLSHSKGFAEAIIASCQFGSPHKKEFRMLGCGLDMKKLETRCPGGHPHVRIEGKYTKPSAMYTPGLAVHLAKAFARALRVKRTADENEVKTVGLESVVSNDLLVSGNWVEEFSWHWRKASHINILESSAYVALLKKITIDGGDCRFTTLLDSQVAKCSHAKGRSSAKALQPTLKKGAAWQVAGGLYPALGFAPTRLNTADGPSREGSIVPTNSPSLSQLLDFRRLQKIHSHGFSRVAAAWIRLVLLASLLQPGSSLSWGGAAGFGWCRDPLGFWGDLLKACWCFLGPGFLAIVCVGVLFLGLGFMASLRSRSLALPCLLLSPCRCLVFWLARGYHHHVRGATYHDLQPLALSLCLTHAVAMPISAVNNEEHARATRRSEVQLVPGRTVLPQTRNRRGGLLEAFDMWLQEEAGFSLATLVDAETPNPEHVCRWLVAYGKQMYYAGKSYARYTETINGIAARRPLLRRQLIGAWDLAFAWSADEPRTHHPALPVSILLALSTLALLWGWPREAAIFMMTWAGVMRVGEALAARRRDLILPSDGAPGQGYALVLIHQPKTRGTAARHQSARVDPADVVALMQATFGRLGKDDLLWNLSPAVLRRRLVSLQKALGLPTQRSQAVVPYDLASLRAGGATFLLQKFEDPSFVRRRGRWWSEREMGVYLQEITIATRSYHLQEATKQRVQLLLEQYPVVLKRSIFMLESLIPASSWPGMR
eukprot:Skav209536  [mRNA]  locus=scaffold2497:55771:60994:- [translate_table: standard]